MIELNSPTKAPPLSSLPTFIGELALKLYRKLRSKLAPILFHRQEGIYLEYAVETIDTPSSAFTRLMDLCEEFMLFLSLDSGEAIKDHLWHQNKYRYNLEKTLYQPLITKISDKGYCLYHTATILRKLELKMLDLDDVFDLSMSIEDIDMMLGLMEEMESKLITAITSTSVDEIRQMNDQDADISTKIYNKVAVHSQEDVDNYLASLPEEEVAAYYAAVNQSRDRRAIRETQLNKSLNPLAETISSVADMKENLEFTDTSIELWKAHKEKYMGNLLHNQALDEGKKGRRRSVPYIDFRPAPWPEAEVLLPLVLKQMVVLYSPVLRSSSQFQSCLGDIIPVLYFDNSEGIVPQYVRNDLSIPQVIALLCNTRNELNKESHHEVLSYSDNIAKDSMVMPATRVFLQIVQKIWANKDQLEEFIYNLLVAFQGECYNAPYPYNLKCSSSEYKRFQDICDLYFHSGKFELRRMDQMTFEQAYVYFNKLRRVEVGEGKHPNDIVLFQWPPYHPVRLLRCHCKMIGLTYMLCSMIYL